MNRFLIQVTMAYRYLKGRKLRTFLTTLAVVFGVMVIFGLNGVLPTIMSTFIQTLGATSEVDITVTSTSGGTFEPALADKIAHVRGVGSVSPALRRLVSLPREGYNGVSAISVIGMNPASALKVREYPVESGRFLRAGDEAVVVMAADLADNIGLKLGQDVELPTARGLRPFRIVGLLNLPVVPGAEEVLMPLATAQTFYNQPGLITLVDASIQSGADRDAVIASVRRAVGEDYQLGGAGAESQWAAAMQIGNVMMNVFGVFALAMGAFIILNTFRTVVAERRRDIGMLRAVGASRGTILGMFFAESLIQGALGTGLGLLAGWGLAVSALGAMKGIYSDLLNINLSGGPSWSPGIWAAAIVLGMGVTILGAIVPAVAAGRITPLDALRPQMGGIYEKAAGRRAWVGLAIIIGAVFGLASQNTGMVGLSAVLVLVGLVLVAPVIVKPVSDVFTSLLSLIFVREGDLANANLQRNTPRAAVTASAMMVSIAIIVALLGTITSVFSGFTGMIQKTMGTDFVALPANFLLGGGNVGAGPELADKIAHVKGVGAVATLRLGAGKVGATSIQAIGIDPTEYPKVASFEFTEGSSKEDIRQLASGRTIIVNGITSSQFGVAKGGRIEIDTPNGRRMYRIVGVGSDYLNAKVATAYMSQDNLARDFNAMSDMMVLADAEAGADRPAVLASLDELLDDYPQFRLYDAAGFREETVDTFESMIGMYYALLLMLGLPSLLALLNTLAMSVLSRTREIGMLRAVGSLKRQVRRMVMAESLLMAALGTSLGIVAGIWLGYVFVTAMHSSGFPIPYYFPWLGILVAMAAGIFFGVIAALIPARQASKLQVVDALRYE